MIKEVLSMCCKTISDLYDEVKKNNGDLDLNILIRSLTIDGREVRLRAGAGIVVDSEAQAELAETRAKARGLLRAFGLAG